MRDTLNTELKTAMKTGDKRRVQTIRLINAAIKDKDIEARGLGKTLTDGDLLALLQKMVKSREESLDIYTKASRADLAQIESDEIAILREFLPKPMSDADVDRAIAAAMTETGASSIKDMGKVVGLLKARHAGTMDMSRVSVVVKKALGG